MRRLPPLLPTLTPLLVASLASAQCETKLLPPDTDAFDLVGRAVDVDGDVVVMGAIGDDELAVNAGAAYTYERVGGSWQMSTKLLASDASSSDVFGQAVTIDGNTILVGAPFAPGVTDRAGAVYVFERMGTDWVETAKLIASDGADFVRFGESVALVGSTAAIGASGDAGGLGSVYFYERNAGVWNFTTKVMASDSVAGDAFGRAISMHGNVALVGAPQNSEAGFDSGAAYLFHDPGTGWVELQKLTASDATSTENFGESVSIFGSALVVGAPGEDQFAAQTGAAYVFETMGGGPWLEVDKLLPADVGANDLVGISVAISDDEIILGATGDDDGAAAAGAVYVFERAGGSWFETGKLIAGDAQAGDILGFGVSIDAGRYVGGATGAADGGESSGTAYVFECIDCNGNGVHDPDEIASGSSADCNGNLVPDECDIAFGRSVDCNANTIPDECDLTGGAYCFCDANTPCGNTYIIGGCGNGANLGGVADACGTGSAAADDLVITTTGLPTNTFGLYFMGPRQGQVPFGDGQRCVFPKGGVGTFRYGVQNTGPAGSVSLGPGIVATSQMRFGASGQIASGDTWNFQLWYRDNQGPCGSGFNLSNGFGVTFTP